MRLHPAKTLTSARSWAALALLVVFVAFSDRLEFRLYHVAALLLNVHRAPPRTLAPGSYGLLMCVRLVATAALWLATCAVLGRGAGSFPLAGNRRLTMLGIGLATGLVVMLADVSGIWLLRSASVGATTQPAFSALTNGGLWLVLDFVGAFGEELFGRAVVLVIAQRLVGWRGAMVVSGIMFSGVHVANPGSTWPWLLRLFFQGALLAYATFRTGSLWWAVGYHTGWNWVSAPLFGAVGSGYTDEGHVLTFAAHGPTWITGGSAGPEGSVFAFAAVLGAFALLLGTTRREPAASSATSPRRSTRS